MLDREDGNHTWRQMLGCMRPQHTGTRKEKDDAQVNCITSTHHRITRRWHEQRLCPYVRWWLRRDEYRYRPCHGSHEHHGRWIRLWRLPWTLWWRLRLRQPQCHGQQQLDAELSGPCTACIVHRTVTPHSTKLHRAWISAGHASAGSTSPHSRISIHITRVLRTTAGTAGIRVLTKKKGEHLPPSNEGEGYPPKNTNEEQPLRNKPQHILKLIRMVLREVRPLRPNNSMPQTTHI